MSYRNGTYSELSQANDRVNRLYREINDLSNRELQALRDRLNARERFASRRLSKTGSDTTAQTAPGHGGLRLDGLCVKVLSRREIDVLTLVATGYSRKEIGESLEITPNTAAKHVSSIYRKLNISTIAEATRIALENGVIEPNTPF